MILPWSGEYERWICGNGVDGMSMCFDFTFGEKKILVGWLHGIDLTEIFQTFLVSKFYSNTVKSLVILSMLTNFLTCLWFPEFQDSTATTAE
jgi:hypothetical protein